MVGENRIPGRMPGGCFPGWTDRQPLGSRLTTFFRARPQDEGGPGSPRTISLSLCGEKAEERWEGGGGWGGGESTVWAGCLKAARLSENKDPGWSARSTPPVRSIQAANPRVQISPSFVYMHTQRRLICTRNLVPSLICTRNVVGQAPSAPPTQGESNAKVRLGSPAREWARQNRSRP